MAKGLKAGTNMTFALVVPYITNPFYPKLVKSVEWHAALRGYSIILFDADENREREIRHFETIVSHAADGVLLSSASDDVAHISVLRSAGIPEVIVSRDFDAGVHRVANDDERGAHAMVCHLPKRGDRRIACLLGNVSLQRYRKRCDGCRRAFAENGVEGFDDYLVTGLDTAEETYAATRRLLAGPKAPTGIFVYIDMLALGVYCAVYDSGLRIPDDVSAVGFDSIPMAQHMFPPLTTYERPTGGIARAAVDSLIEQIENPRRAIPPKTVVDGGLVARKSVRVV